MMTGKPSMGLYHGSDDALSAAQGQRAGAEFSARVATAQYVNAVHARKFGDYVHDRLAKQYHPETFAQMKVDVHTDNNVLNDVLEKLCVAWADGAEYTLYAEDGEYDDEDGAHADFLSVADFDNLMRCLDTLTEMHPRVAVAPSVFRQERSGERVFCWSIHDPSTFNLVCDEHNQSDFQELDTYGWRMVRGVMRRHKTVWRSDVYAEMFLNDRGSWEITHEVDNQYGTIPFVLFGGAKPTVSPWLDCVGEELADVTVSVCCAETVLENKSLAQVKVLAGEFKDFPRGQVLKHGGVIETGDAQNISLLDYQTDVAAFAEVFVQRPRRNALASVGLGVDEFEQTGTPASGEALKMRYASRDRRAVNKRKYLRASAVELYWMAQHVLAHQIGAADEDGTISPIHGITSTVPYDPVTRSSPLRLGIDVNEITYPELAAERATAEDRDLSLGLTNVADLYMKRNPDVTNREAAVAAVVRNRVLNVRLADNVSMKRLGPAVARASEPAAVEAALLVR